MLKKSRKSAIFLSAICAGCIFFWLMLLQQPRLDTLELAGFSIVMGIFLLAAATATFYSMIARLDERYFGLPGALGWALTGSFTALTVWVGQRFWPDPFGMAILAVLGFILFRWLAFQAIWRVQRQLNKN
jgi:hypothetical protein